MSNLIPTELVVPIHDTLHLTHELRREPFLFNILMHQSDEYRAKCVQAALSDAGVAKALDSYMRFRSLDGLGCQASNAISVAEAIGERVKALVLGDKSLTATVTRYTGASGVFVGYYIAGTPIDRPATDLAEAFKEYDRNQEASNDAADAEAVAAVA